MLSSNPWFVRSLLILSAVGLSVSPAAAAGASPPSSQEGPGSPHHSYRLTRDGILYLTDPAHHRIYKLAALEEGARDP